MSHLFLIVYTLTALAVVLAATVACIWLIVRNARAHPRPADRTPAVGDPRSPLWH